MRSVFIPYFVAALFFLTAISGCAFLYPELEKPGIQLVSISPQQISFSGVKLRCRVRVDNPNDISIPVKGGQINLQIEGTQIAHGALGDGFTVAAGGSELVDVIVEVDSGGSFALAVQLLKAGEQEIDYALTGYIDIAIGMLGRVSIHETGSIPLTGKPTVNKGDSSVI
ncbi:MAG: LEA type 2 family protein [Gammaproteobacteria bacterium]|jgi:LEA14-like dessication related protein|nr:hypothetical protein [Chromatiales bacterium]MDP6674327.1 LEA type 2 family protein [Gammaproteobacteria bacterium]